MTERVRPVFRMAPPQQQAETCCGLLLIADLIEQGLVEGGPFHVEVDKAYNELRRLVQCDGVSEPAHEAAVREAIRVMGWRDSLDEADYEIVTFLLRHKARIEWPP